METAAFDIQASILRRAAVDQNAFAEGLAVRLAEALPGHVTVERRGWGILRGRRIVRIVVNLEAFRYTLALDGQDWHAERVPMVRGVGLRRERMALPAWLSGLVAAVESSADQQSAAMVTLHTFLMS